MILRVGGLQQQLRSTLSCRPMAHLQVLVSIFQTSLHGQVFLLRLDNASALGIPLVVGSRCAVSKIILLTVAGLIKLPG